jgi:hypothetical protein
MTENSTPLDTEPICENCIWHHDWEGLLRTGPCSPQSWAGSVRAALAEHGIFPDLATPSGAFAAFPYCAAVMMIKDEADIIGTTLIWLYHIGVRRFVVLDNNSDDATPDILEAFRAAHPHAEVALLHDPTVEYLQAEKMNAACRIARDLWPDLRWLLPIDADEFLIVRHGLQALAYVPDTIDALTIPKAVHFYPRGAESPDGTGPADLAPMSIRSHIFAVPPKVLLRASADLLLTQGNHKAASQSGRSVAYAGGLAHGFYYREFQNRSFPQFLSKVRNGGAAILVARAKGHGIGGDHWIDWYDILQRGGQAALWATYQDVAYRDLGPGYISDPFTGAATLPAS